MKNLFFRNFLLLLTLLPGAIVPCNTAEAQTATGSQVLQTVTSLPVQTLAGAPLDIAADESWRVVYIWSAMCPCVRLCEMESLIPLSRKYAGQVTFYAVMSSKLDQDIPINTLQKIIDSHNLPYPVYIDPHQKTANALGAQIAGQVFLINPQNQVLYDGMADDSRAYVERTDQVGVTKTYLADALRQALSGEPLTLQKTPLTGCAICPG